jgi:hypothetical protein
MKAVRISALFLLGITTAYEQVGRTQITYNSGIKCPQSFCDAFFEDESICEFSGTHALIYERDGECGIEINDAEVTCSVQCHEAVVISDEMKRGGLIGASEERSYTSSPKTDIIVAFTLGTVPLAIGIVLCLCGCSRQCSGRDVTISIHSNAERIRKIGLCARGSCLMQKGSGKIGFDYRPSIAKDSEADGTSTGSKVHRALLSRTVGLAHGATSEMEADELLRASLDM